MHDMMEKIGIDPKGWVVPITVSPSHSKQTGHILVARGQRSSPVYPEHLGRLLLLFSLQNLPAIFTRVLIKLYFI